MSVECPEGSSSIVTSIVFSELERESFFPTTPGLSRAIGDTDRWGVSVFPRRKERRSQWLQVIFSACENIPTASLRLVTPSSPSPSRTVNSVLFVDDSSLFLPYLPFSFALRRILGTEGAIVHGCTPSGDRRRGPNKFAPRSARGSYNGRRLRAYIFFRVMLLRYRLSACTCVRELKAGKHWAA